MSEVNYTEGTEPHQLGNYKLGLLLNFNAPILVKGIKRIIN